MERDLTAVVRDAWAVLRLAKLHEVVQRTIDELGSVSPHDLLGHDVPAPRFEPAASPIALALAACSEELRFEAGVAPTRESREAQWEQVRRNMAVSADWTDTFTEALAGYRSRAGLILKVACDAACAKL